MKNGEELRARERIITPKPCMICRDGKIHNNILQHASRKHSAIFQNYMTTKPFPNGILADNFFTMRNKGIFGINRD